MITVRLYENTDLPRMAEIWNEVVEEGIAFPQEEALNSETGPVFFAAQTACGVAVDETGQVQGLYILHPNNVGRCGHIANASYAVSSACRGRHIGEKLVLHCLKTAREKGFRIMQFNAVVASNIHARHLYERLGFTQLGVIPGGFRLKDGRMEDICPYFKVL
ncbi:MAG: GNAT family N-acetyltransferase [Clostridia bacterium]|nr:GNAT family N-acetyltransferase [Clostridia bacterium]